MEDKKMKNKYTEPIMRAIIIKSGPRLLADSHAARGRMDNNTIIEFGGIDDDGTLDPE